MKYEDTWSRKMFKFLGALEKVFFEQKLKTKLKSNFLWQYSIILPCLRLLVERTQLDKIIGHILLNCFKSLIEGLMGSRNRLVERTNQTLSIITTKNVRRRFCRRKNVVAPPFTLSFSFLQFNKVVHGKPGLTWGRLAAVIRSYCSGSEWENDFQADSSGRPGVDVIKRFYVVLDTETK